MNGIDRKSNSDIPGRARPVDRFPAPDRRAGHRPNRAPDTASLASGDPVVRLGPVAAPNLVGRPVTAGASLLIFGLLAPALLIGRLRRVAVPIRSREGLGPESPVLAFDKPDTDKAPRSLPSPCENVAVRHPADVLNSFRTRAGK